MFKLYLHADSPCTPDDGTQVADGDTVADTVGLLVALAADGGGNKADAVDDAVGQTVTPDNFADHFIFDDEDDDEDMDEEDDGDEDFDDGISDDDLSDNN